MVNYGVNYRLDYCDFIGRRCRIDILNKDYTGGIIPYSAGAEPLEIDYKNDNEDKFNQLTGSEAKISILSSDAFSLQTFYVEDEKQFLAKYYVDGLLEWSGFILPDSANEPFLVAPYDSSLQAKDILGTLKTIPFVTADGVTIKKIDNLKNIIAICLAKTGLNLDFWTGINTYETRMPNGLADDPLALTFIDTNRYIDTNGLPYSCYDVLNEICNEFSANIKQSAGAWWIVDITLLSNDSYNARHYDYTGAYIARATISVDKQAGLNKQLELVDHDHEFSNILGYKSVTSYYQYGYLSNKLINGDFNLLNVAGAANPFLNWTISNLGGTNLTVKSVQRTATSNGVTKLIDDFYALIGPVQNGASLKSDAFTILTTNTLAASVDVGSQNAVANDCQLLVSFIITLNGPGQDTRFWTSKGWSNGSIAQGGNVFNFTTDWSKGDTGKAINFDITNPPYDGTLTFGIEGGHFIVSTVPQASVPLAFDNVSIQSSEDQYFKSPIGNVITATQSNNYSSVPDVTTLLFGDDIKKDRTSWMRLSDGSPTKTWYRYGNSESLQLQEIVTRNILNQHQKTSRLFEGTLMGALNPMDTIRIQLVDSKFFFLAGTFYSRAAKCKVKLAEIFTHELPAAQVSINTFEDFGEFKDKDGNTVGSPTGVSIGGGGSGINIDPNAYIHNQANYQTDAQFNVSKGVFNNALIVPVVAPILEPGQAGVWIGTISGVTNNPGDNGSDYILPIAGVSSLGGVKIGSGINIAADGTISVGTINLSNYYNKAESDIRFLPINGTAVNSLGFNGYTLDKSSAYDTGFDLIFARTTSIGEARFINAQGMRNFIGASVTSQSNSVVLRDASGYINAGYFNTSATTENAIGSVNRLFGGYNNDGFIRPLTNGAVNVFLGMPALGDTFQSVTTRGNVATTAIGIAADNVGHDPYGIMSVTRTTTGNLSYYGLTRSGQIGWGFGVSTDNSLIWGTGSALGSNGGVITSVLAKLRYDSGGVFNTGYVQANTQFQNLGGGFKSLAYTGMVGNYDAQGNTDMIIWTIGDQWNQLSTMYGLGYSYNNELRNGMHQIVARLNGSTGVSLGMDGIIIANQKVVSGTGTNGGFENYSYGSGHNNIWRFGSSPEYGLGYYQGGAEGDYIGFHFGNRFTPAITITNSTMFAPIVKASQKLSVPTSYPSSLASGEAAIWIGNLSGITN